MSSLSPERKVAVLLRKAWTYADSKDTDAALSTMDEALAIQPESPLLHRDRTDMLARAGRVEQALAGARQGIAAVGETPAAADLHVREGDLLRRLGRPEEALAAYAQALARDPAHAASIAQIGNALAELGRFADALERFDALVALRPKDAEAALCRGLVLAKLERHDEGLAEIDRAIDHDPKLLEAYLQRARLLRRAGRVVEARDAADLAIEKTPRYVEGYVIAADLALDRGDVDEAFALADKAQQIDETDAQVWRIKSLAHARKGRAAAATVCRALHFLGLGQGEAALAEVDAAIDLDPGFVPAWHQRGVILTALDRLADAEASFRKAVALDDRAARALRDLGVLLGERLGRRDDAIRVLQQAIAVDPKLWKTIPQDLQKRVNKPSFW